MRGTETKTQRCQGGKTKTRGHTPKKGLLGVGQKGKDFLKKKKKKGQEGGNWHVCQRGWVNKNWRWGRFAARDWGKEQKNEGWRKTKEGGGGREKFMRDRDKHVREDL